MTERHHYAVPFGHLWAVITEGRKLPLALFETELAAKADARRRDHATDQTDRETAEEGSEE